MTPALLLMSLIFMVSYIQNWENQNDGLLEVKLGGRFTRTVRRRLKVLLPRQRTRDS